MTQPMTSKRNDLVLLSACVVIPLLILLFDLLTTQGDLPSQLAMHLTAGRLVLDGQIPYADFFDWVPPIVFDLALIPYYLRSIISLPDTNQSIEIITKCLIWIVTCSSITACIVLSRTARSESTDRGSTSLFPICLSLITFCFFARLQFGEPQFFFVLALAPWMVCRSLSYQHISSNRPVAFLVGTFIVLMCAIEPTFAIVPCVLEFVFLCLHRRIPALRLPEHAGILFGLIIVIISFALLPNRANEIYWQWILPLRLISYNFYDAVMVQRHGTPDQSYIIYAFAAVVFVHFCYKTSSQFRTLLACGAVTGLILFFVEREAFTRDALIAAFFIFALIAVYLKDMLQIANRFIASSHGSMIFQFMAPVSMGIAAFFYLQSLHTVSNVVSFGSDSVNDFVRSKSQPGDKILILCDYPDASYPAIFNYGRTPAGYLLFARPCKLLNALQQQHLLNEQKLAFHKFIVNKVTAAIQSQAPHVVLVQDGLVAQFLIDNSIAVPLLKNYVKSKQSIRFGDLNRQPSEYLGINSFHAYTRVEQKANE